MDATYEPACAELFSDGEPEESEGFPRRALAQRPRRRFVEKAAEFEPVASDLATASRWSVLVAGGWRGPTGRVVVCNVASPNAQRNEELE